MELKQMEYFRAIADAGSISDGARRLHMSQPPLSYQMKLLEEELGVRLFERGSRKIRLTKAGKIFYERTESILNLTQSTVREVGDTGKHEVLHLGLTPTTGPVLLPYIRHFSGLFPDVRFEVYDGSTFTLSGLLDYGIVEVAAIRTPTRLENAGTLYISHESMLAVFPPSFSAGHTADISLSEIAAHPVIIYRRYHELIMKAFHDRFLNPDIFCECDDARTALQWVREGLGCAIFPDSMHSLCQDLPVFRIGEPELVTDIFLAWKKEREDMELLQKFLSVFPLSHSHT